jgi:hypothetical protein
VLLVFRAQLIIIVQDALEHTKATLIWEEISNCIKKVRSFAFQPGAQSSALDRLLCEGFHTARMPSLTIPGVNLQHKEFRSFSVCIK